MAKHDVAQWPRPDKNLKGGVSMSITGRYNLRKYGPGKFVHCVDEVIYGASMLQFYDEQVNMGDFNAFLFVGSLHGFVNPEHKLTADEHQLLFDSVGCIMTETGTGLVGIKYYDDHDELMREWKHFVLAEKRFWEEEDAE